MEEDGDPGNPDAGIPGGGAGEIQTPTAGERRAAFAGSRASNHGISNGISGEAPPPPVFPPRKAEAPRNSKDGGGEQFEGSSDTVALPPHDFCVKL